MDAQKPKHEPKEQILIAKVMTRSSFLHINRAFEIDKLQFWLGSYKKGQGTNDHSNAYLSLDAARVVFGDLMLRGGLPKKLYADQRIEFFGGSEREGNLQARVLTFSEDQTKRAPILISIASGPGKYNKTGGIQPVGTLQKISIFLSIFEARKLAASVMADIHAWDVVRMAQQRKKQPYHTTNTRNSVHQ